MKKLKKIVGIAAAVVGIAAAVLVLLLAGFLFLYQNWHSLVDLRAFAHACDGGVMIEQLSDGVRVQSPYSDDYVVFNSDRECVESSGITPIEFNHPNMRAYDGYDAFEAEYGAAHIQWGSGVFWPVYITSDGYLLVMWNPNDHDWSEVWMEDLLAAAE